MIRWGLVPWLVVLAIAPAPVRAGDCDDLARRVAELSIPAASWPASAVLQRCGPSAIALLVDRLAADPFADRHHGNHSATMKALEKIGPAALPALAGFLTDERLADSSAGAACLSALLVTRRIAPAQAVPHAVRAVRRGSAPLRLEALRLLLGSEFYFGRLTFGGFGVPRLPPTQEERAALDSALREAAAALRDLRIDPGEGPWPTIALGELWARWGDPTLRARGLDALTRAARDVVSGMSGSALLALARAGALDGQLEAALWAAGRPAYERAELADTLLVVGASPAARELARTLIVGLLGDSDPTQRARAIGVAGRSRELLLVPPLIERLGDDGPSRTTTTVDGKSSAHPLSEAALEALERLTHAELGPDAAAWRRWWAEHGDRDRRELYSAALRRAEGGFIELQPWRRNLLVESLAEPDAAFLPLARTWLRSSDLDSSQVAMHSYRGGMGHEHAVITALAELAMEGDENARALLLEATTIRDAPLAAAARWAVALFDRPRALAALRAEMSRPGCQWDTARDVAALGDRGAIDEWLGCLADENETLRALAFPDLRSYTQRELPFDAAASPAERAAQLAAWRRWWSGVPEDWSPRVRAAQIDGEDFF